MPILEFKIKTHYGRKDFYPVNEGARQVLEFKVMLVGSIAKCLKKNELEKLKALGFEVKIIQDLEAV